MSRQPSSIADGGSGQTSAQAARRRFLLGGLGLAVGGCSTSPAIDGVARGPKAPADAPPPPPGLEAVPDVRLAAHDGTEWRFRSDLLIDRCVVLHFFYTRCSGSCPSTIATLLQLRQTVAAEAGQRIWFYSISLDPARDSVASLSDYAGQLRLDADAQLRNQAPWLLLTGKEPDIERLRRGLGYRDLDPAIDADRSRHAAMFTVGNTASGRWATLPAAASPERLAATTLRIVGATEVARYSRFSI